MYDCMEGDRRLLFEAMVLPLSELTAQAGRKPSLVDNAYVALKEVIRDGVLPPGYQGSEQKIAGKLNMSARPSMRRSFAYSPKVWLRFFPSAECSFVLFLRMTCERSMMLSSLASPWRRNSSLRFLSQSVALRPVPSMLLMPPWSCLTRE